MYRDGKDGGGGEEGDMGVGSNKVSQRHCFYMRIHNITIRK